MKTISFRDNVGARHGEVLRSSAIFYVREDATTQSTISFMNYWKLKRGVEVAVFASTRNMKGELLLRERLNFGQGEVINYRVPADGPFEGSIEIEVFSTQNMAIPYSAIVCIYETSRGYSFVHSYARAYSHHEIEEGRTLSTGREACWTCRDTPLQRSFAVIHNGSLVKEAQRLRLIVRNGRQETREVSFDWPALQPYETRRIRPGDHLPDLAAWLGGEPGQAKLDFELGAGFTRMLVGNERLDATDMQVTHSNFDYGRQPTDMTEPGQQAFMHLPACGNAKLKLIIYPDSHKGDYRLHSVEGSTLSFSGGDAIYQVAPKSETLVFERTDGPMPTRLVTALEIHENTDRLPGECSLGVLTALQPAKRLWWGSVASPQTAASRLVIHDLHQVYGGIPEGEELHLSLHSASRSEPIKATLKADRLNEFSNGISIEDIWPGAKQHLGGQAGYYTMFCSYGGLTVYTLTRNVHGSVCLEHGF
jgi:hypothetical protein